MQHQQVIDLASDDESVDGSSGSRRSRRRTPSPDLLDGTPENSPPRARLRRDNAAQNDSRATGSNRSSRVAAAGRTGRQQVISLMDSPDVQQRFLSRATNITAATQQINSNHRNNSDRENYRHRNSRSSSSNRTSTTQWACGRCTLLNSRHSSTCLACETPRANNQDSDDEVIYERTTNTNNSTHPTSHYVGGGAFLGGMIGAADGYANGTGVARGAVRGAMSGAVGGVLMGEVMRGAPPPPRSTNYQSAAAAAGASYRSGSNSDNNDGWGRRDSNHSIPASFRAYPIRGNGTYIRNNSTIFDQFFQSMQQHRLQPNIDAMSYDQILERFGDGNENRNLAASPQVISSLPSSTVSDPDELPEDKRLCVICMEEYEAGDERTMLPCWHDFHKGCVNRWLESKGSCPVCKTDVG